MGMKLNEKMHTMCDKSHPYIYQKQNQNNNKKKKMHAKATKIKRQIPF